MRDQSSPTDAPQDPLNPSRPGSSPAGRDSLDGEAGSRLQQRGSGGGGGQHLRWIVRPRSRSGRRCAAGFVVAWRQRGLERSGVGFRSWRLADSGPFASSVWPCESWMLESNPASCKSKRARGFKRGATAALICD